MQHRHLLRDGVARDERDIFFRDAQVMEFGCEGVAEGVEAHTLRKAEVPQVAPELVQDALAVAGIGLSGLSVHAGREVWEEARVPACAHVFNEVDEACVQEWIGDGQGPNRSLAFEALTAPAGGLVRQVGIDRLLDADAPHTALLNDVGQLELSDFVDASSCVEANHRGPPAMRVRFGPRNEGAWGKDALEVVVVEQPFRSVRVDG